jgi:uncharacterized protein YlzI (FlbEa/FlbD family)
MEEEKGGVLYIIFIFIGVACLSLGAFEFFTDEKIDLKEDPNYTKNEIDNTQNEDKDLISQLNIIKNVDTTLTLKNGNKVVIKYYVDEETNKGSFTYNGKTSYETNELELCDKYYLYNDYIISSCVFTSATSGHLYIIDDKGTSTKVTSFKDNGYDFIPESINIKDEKLVITGISVLEGAKIKINDKEIDLCNEEEIKENNISTDSVANADFEFSIVEGSPVYKLIKTNTTIKEFIDESCKIVE